MSDKTTIATRGKGNLAVSIERQALRDMIASISRPGRGESDWCIACGAGAASNKLDLPQDVIQQIGTDLTLDAVKDFVGGLGDVGEQAWCIACGAGKDASPIGEIVNPADIDDATIDTLAEKIIGAVKIGK